MKVGLLNAQSIGNKFTVINNIIAERHLDTLLLTETWHQTGNDTALKRCAPPGYVIHDVPRPGCEGHPSRGGGLAAIFSSSLSLKESKKHINTKTFESTLFTIGSRSSTVAVLLIYRPGSTPPTEQFFTELTAYLEVVALYQCEVVITGDFNINIGDHTSGNATRLLELLTSFNLIQHIGQPTQTRGGILDLLIAQREGISDVTVEPPGCFSDHSLITWRLSFNQDRPSFVQKKVRRWHRLDCEGFRKALRKSPLCSPLPAESAANELFDIYETVTRELADVFAPVQETTTVRRRRIAIWFDDECRRLRRKSRALERKYRKTGTADDRLAWVQHEKERHRIHRLKENSYWMAEISDSKGNSRKLWKTFSAIMGLDNAANIPVGSPSAQALMDYFVQKVESIRQSTGDNTPLTYLKPSSVHLTNFKVYTTEAIEKTILSLPSKSCSLDPIPTKILKKFLPDFLPFITEMCNQSLIEGFLPISQRHAILKPKLKKNGLDVSDVRNYRPISNLTYISKLVERLVYKQVLEHLENNGLLPKLQSGFRRRHSTETALIKVLSDIFMAMDEGKVVLLGLLDMSAAFDLVDHDILLTRLKVSYGFDDVVLTWFHSFMSARTQQVFHDGSLSSTVPVGSGVPQGSVLGPLLFLLYSADIIEIAVKHNIGVHFYADDGQLYFSGKTGQADSMAQKVSDCVEEIDSWMASNRLKLNTEKTQVIWIGSWQLRRQLSRDPTIKLGTSWIQTQETVVDLGVLIDGELSMKEHIQRTCSSSFYQLRQIWRVRKSLPRKALETLVHAFVTSRLDYCNGALYGISESGVMKLQSVMRTAARLISGRRKFDSITPYIRDILHWLPVKQRVEYKLCVMVYRCLHGDAPKYLEEMLLPISGNRELSHLRAAVKGKLIVPRTRTRTLGPRGFAASGPSLWNALPDHLRDASLTMDQFKKELKTFLFRKGYDIS